ncbi:hypothetical protein JCM8202_004752 [Rhodotorula sphaerocarpa]
MPFAVAPYLEPYGAHLRPLGYYAAWTAYYLSFILSPGLVTVLQVLILILGWTLPTLETAVELARARLLYSAWVRDDWAWPGWVGRGRGRQAAAWPLWMQAALTYVDMRWAFVAAWAACVVKLRGLSRWMGWDRSLAAQGPPLAMGPLGGRRLATTAPRPVGPQPDPFYPSPVPMPEAVPPFSTTTTTTSGLKGPTGLGMYRRRHQQQPPPPQPYPLRQATVLRRPEPPIPAGSSSLEPAYSSRHPDPFSPTAPLSEARLRSVSTRSPSVRSAYGRGPAWEEPFDNYELGSAWSGSGGRW